MPYSQFAKALAVIGMLMLSQSAQAQQQLTDDGRHLIRIGIAGGLIVPTSDARAELEQGVQAQGFLLVNVIPGMPLRLNLGYQKFNLKQALTAGTTSTTSADNGSTQILAGVAGTQLDLLHGPVRPYVVFGIGGFDVRNVLTAAAAGTSTSQLKFGVDGGAGITIKIGRLNAFVEGHLQNVYTDRGMIDAKSIQAVPVSFGVLF